MYIFRIFREIHSMHSHVPQATYQQCADLVLEDLEHHVPGERSVDAGRRGAGVGDADGQRRMQGSVTGCAIDASASIMREQGQRMQRAHLQPLEGLVSALNLAECCTSSGTIAAATRVGVLVRRVRSAPLGGGGGQRGMCRGVLLQDAAAFEQVFSASSSERKILLTIISHEISHILNLTKQFQQNKIVTRKDS